MKLQLSVKRYDQAPTIQNKRSSPQSMSVQLIILGLLKFGRFLDKNYSITLYINMFLNVNPL